MCPVEIGEKPKTTRHATAREAFRVSSAWECQLSWPESGDRHLIPRPHVEAGGVHVAGLHRASSSSERHNWVLAGCGPTATERCVLELTKNPKLAG